MQWQQVSSETSAAKWLAERLVSLLANHGKLLLLIPGGSGAAVAAQALQAVGPRAKLYLSLTDERYGSPGHTDSNWALLESLGLDFNAWQSYPILSGQNAPSTAEKFDGWLAEQLADTAYRCGLFGIGADGHTSGLLPGSPALESERLAAHYQATDFERITTTPKLITQLDETFLYAVGAAKYAQLDRLSATIDISEQPAQILKQTKLTILSDKGE